MNHNIRFHLLIMILGRREDGYNNRTVKYLILLFTRGPPPPPSHNIPSHVPFLLTDCHFGEDRHLHLYGSKIYLESNFRIDEPLV